MPTRVLVVIEKDFRFKTAVSPDFTFNTLMKALMDAFGVVNVKKAYRRTDPIVFDADADFNDFHFAMPDLINNYDVIWLLGREGRNEDPGSTDPSLNLLADGELTAIAQFMEAGGGVFATGDHDSIGASMCGAMPRIRAMRTWFGSGDPTRPVELAGIGDNYTVSGSGRADTTEFSPLSDYTEHNPPSPYRWFENQSDSVPQTIHPVAPTHYILRREGLPDITHFPDHMHEGNTLDGTSGFDFNNTKSPFGDTAKDEFRSVAGQRELPQIIATGTIPGGNAVWTADNDMQLDLTFSAPGKPPNTLSVYDGRNAGVGRIVTGSTFHHYIDINLTGATGTVNIANKVGPDAVAGKGFTNTDAMKQITAAYVNITTWLARPQPAIGLILERSTFSQDEVAAQAGQQFDGVILLTVDGLKPTQFPGMGGIPNLGPIVGNPAWVPQITVPMGVPIQINPQSVDSEDPGMPIHDRVQRFTFTYNVKFTSNAFTFPDNSSNVPVSATLSPTVPGVLNDSATIVLVKSANPFMLDLADKNKTTWLSSDVKIFHVVEGDSFFGFDLPMGADRNAALAYINNMAANIDSATFTTLPSDEEKSSLSPVATTTGSGKKVYNFALARVRLSSAGADANGVRVFFRVFGAPTTASLTYHLDGGMPPMPIDAYLKTPGVNPISLPGSQNGQWVSFPMFATNRQLPTDSQPIGPNLQDIKAAKGFKIFGALVDNNLKDFPYLKQMPGGGGGLQYLPDLLAGEHQCIVAQIEYGNAPIPDGATPWTSDKLSQRNIAFSTVANPGLEASRVAVHTFEMEATPIPISASMPPDELLLNWPTPAPDGTVLRFHLPTWNARDVVDLADRFYARHEIEAIDDHTIQMPAGGTRYVPIPTSYQRQTGVLEVEFPLGIRKGQRFDVSIRQITNRFRQAPIPPPRMQKISLEEASKIIDALPPVPGVAAATVKRGAYDLGNNKVLYTNLTYFDMVSDHALIIEHPDPAVVKAAVANAARWRVPIGAFQLAVPVSTKTDMLPYHARLLSVMRWRAAQMPRQSRWYKTMQRYLDVLSVKVQALGGNPWAIPATPDGEIPMPGQGGGHGPDNPLDLIKKLLSQPLGCALALVIALLIIILLVLLFQ